MRADLRKKVCVSRVKARVATVCKINKEMEVSGNEQNCDQSFV